MKHWSEYLSAAIVHAECMKLAPIQIDIAQLAGALAAFQREQARMSGLIGVGGGAGFDPRLLKSVG